MYAVAALRVLAIGFHNCNDRGLRCDAHVISPPWITDSGGKAGGGRVGPARAFGRALGGGLKRPRADGGLLRGFLSALGPIDGHPPGHRLLLFGRHSHGVSSSSGRRAGSPRPGWPQPPYAAKRSPEPRASPTGRRSRGSDGTYRSSRAAPRCQLAVCAHAVGASPAGDRRTTRSE